MDFNKIKKIYFVGIGGIGLSAIAKMMLAKKKKVFGSDLKMSEITTDLRKQGAKIFKGHKRENLASDTDLLIYSPAVPENNPERIKARKLGIPQFSYPEFLGMLSRQYFTIAISGTNGKSTTTSILGLILEKAGFDPTVIVGSKVPQWKGNSRLGKSAFNIRVNPRLYPRESAFLVVEACEWRAHMLNLQPKIIVLTNIEKDHLDYYRNLNHIIKTFQKYINKLPKNGILVFNADDKNLKKLKPKSKKITYGIKNRADVSAKNIALKNGKQEFDIIYSKLKIHVSTSIPGLFNVYNMLAAVSTALALNIKPKKIKESLESFFGIWRRFEIINADKCGYLRKFTPKITLISDYAHHPTAIFKTIKAVKEFYPNRRIVSVFQPHLHSRTKKLFNDFVKSFDLADLIIISEIYDVAGRDNIDRDISSKDLVKEISLRFKNRKLKSKIIFYGRNLKETKEILLKNIKPNDVVLIMGAGDIYKIVNNLKNV